jgi:hypothetical protein
VASFFGQISEGFNLPVGAAVFPVASVVLPIKPGLTMQAKLLCAFAKLQKAAISFVVSVCPSARMEKLGSR